MITHEPAPVGVKVVVEIVQLPETTLQVSAPEPSPPVAVSESVEPYVTLVEVTEIALWLIFAIAMLNTLAEPVL